MSCTNPRRLCLVLMAAACLLIPAGHPAAASMLGWTTGGSPGMIQTAYRDGTNIQPLPNPQTGSFAEIHYSDSTGQWFWFDWHSIKRADFDGANAQVVATDNDMYTTSGDFAIDDVNQWVYWVNSTGQLRRIDFDGSNAVTLRTDLVSPRAVEVDPVNGKLFWVEYGQINAPVCMANLNGTGKTTIALVSSLRAISDLAVDPQAQQLYWTATSSFRTEQVQRRGFSYGPATTLLDMELGNLSDVTLDLNSGNMLLVNSSSGIIYEANLDGSQLAPLVSDSSNRPLHVAISPIPEPSTAMLTLLAGLSLLAYAWRRRS